MPLTTGGGALRCVPRSRDRRLPARCVRSPCACASTLGVGAVLVTGGHDRASRVAPTREGGLLRCFGGRRRRRWLGFGLGASGWKLAGLDVVRGRVRAEHDVHHAL